MSDLTHFCSFIHSPVNQQTSFLEQNNVAIGWFSKADTGSSSLVAFVLQANYIASLNNVSTELQKKCQNQQSIRGSLIYRAANTPLPGLGRQSLFRRALRPNVHA